MGQFFRFLNIAFIFGTLQAFVKARWEIDRLQSEETGFARMPAPSFKNLPESLATPAALDFLISCMIFKTFLFRRADQSAVIAKLM